MLAVSILIAAGATALALWIANPARPLSEAGYWRHVRRHNLKRERGPVGLRPTTITRK